MRPGDPPQHPAPATDPAAVFRRAERERVETMVSAGWTWVEAVDAVVQDAPGARATVGERAS